MKRLLLITTFVCSTTLTLGQEGGRNFIDLNYIEVTGVAEQEVIPNEIYLQVLVSEKDNKAKEPLEQREAKMISKLQEIGLDVEEQLSVKDFASKFQFYFLRKTESFSSREYEVLVYDAQAAGKVIVELEAIGISNINVSKVDHSELDSLIIEVKKKAILNAKKKANAMANTLELKIGKAIHIQEFNGRDDVVVLRSQTTGIRIRGASSIYGNRSAEPNINFQKVKIESKVIVKFTLEE